jgi:hypothetical protein
MGSSPFKFLTPNGRIQGAALPFKPLFFNFFDHILSTLAMHGLKGKNFVREEEEQLCYSVLHVSQDRIVGNQQKGGVFWSRISQHYDEYRPAGFRPSRSLESKWGLLNMMYLDLLGFMHKF